MWGHYSLAFYRASRGLEDADWLMLPAYLLAACAPANSDYAYCGEEALLRALGN